MYRFFIDFTSQKPVISGKRKPCTGVFLRGPDRPRTPPYRQQPRRDPPAHSEHPDLPVRGVRVGGDVLPGRSVPAGHPRGRPPAAHHPDEVRPGVRLQGGV